MVGGDERGSRYDGAAVRRGPLHRWLACHVGGTVEAETLVSARRHGPLKEDCDGSLRGTKACWAVSPLAIGRAQEAARRGGLRDCMAERWASQAARVRMQSSAVRESEAVPRTVVR